MRLLPKPYNHPIRTAESVAVLDLISDGRVEFGTGRSSTRAELEGFDIDPHETREMWSEALGHIVSAWTEEQYQADGKYWKMGAPRRVQPKPLQKPHPPMWGATSSPDGHREIGRHGLGLCSFTVGVPPEELSERIALYRGGPGRVHATGRQVRQRPGGHVHDGALRADQGGGLRGAPPSRSPGTCSYGAGLIASVAELLEGKDLGTYGYAGDAAASTTRPATST